MNLESILELALAIGRVVLALVFVGCILTLLMQ
jgi:cbb3-type cytochrome oxidase subunit 3